MSLFDHLMATHLRGMVRKAVLIVGDVATAEDCVQDAYIAVHRAIENGTVRDESHAIGYLNNAVDSEAISVQRRRATARKHQHELLPDDEPGAESTVVDRLTSAAETQALRSALDQLTDRERQVIVLRHFEGLSVQATAKRLGVSEGTVKEAASRARTKLAKIIGRRS